MSEPLAEEVRRLARRLAEVDAAAAVGRLKRRYAQLCDDGYDGAALGELFTDGGTWRSNHDGPFAGREAVSAFLAGVGTGRFSWAAHYLANEVVDVDLDRGTASGRWELVQLATDRQAAPGPGASVVATGTYRDTFALVDGAWRIVSLDLELHRVGDLGSGW